ncbi:MAG: M14 family metallopeptidase [Bacteroidota bacterium]
MLLSAVTSAQSKIPSPVDFMPHPYGAAFTPHHLLVGYFKEVAKQSDRVVLKEYGQTNEYRPLIYAVVSSPENLARLEDIRLNQLRKAGRGQGKLLNESLPVIWLSYGVHGNEAGASESSIATLYELATSDQMLDFLKNTVVIIDPCLNPDGFDRYNYWNRSVGGQLVDPAPSTREHQEPWPGGRVNHYLFDLNRDWAWQTQLESRQRLELYYQWMPQVHVDYHEMGYNSPYYFAPAAQPYHQYITPWQADFQTLVGQNHARYFDKEGWLYYTGEVFDLLYPSYGDTYPTFNGAIGMTYEQGGHSRAGRAILMENGDTLTLSDRIAHHLATGLSSVEMTSKNAKELDENFIDYFKKASEKPVGKYKSFLIRSTNPSARIKALCELLDRNQITYGRIRENGKAMRAFDYRSGTTRPVKQNKGDLIISAYQAQSVLLQVLFEPTPYLADSLTYDITAWALPYAYGLEAYAFEDKISSKEPFTFNDPNLPAKASKVYAYMIPWESLHSARFLAQALDRGLKVRRVTETCRSKGMTAEPGALLITRGDNEGQNPQWEEVVLQLAKEIDQEVFPLQTGFSLDGPDLGSSKLKLVERPKVLLPSGNSNNANAFGEAWYYFDEVLHYPVSIIDVGKLRKLDLEPYNLIVLPEGNYSGKFNMDRLSDWIAKGGRLIVMGRALSWLEGRSGFALTKNVNQEISKSSPVHLHPYEGRERRNISNTMPGAILRLEMDDSHPLAYGLSDTYFSLKTNTRVYKRLSNCWNVGYSSSNPKIIGFTGAKVRKTLSNKTYFAVEKKGKGNIVYMADNPLFRCFWYNGMMLFSNAVFMQDP